MCDDSWDIDNLKTAVYRLADILGYDVEFHDYDYPEFKKREEDK